METAESTEDVKNVENIEISSLKDVLKCMICHDMATIPVHLNCCENSKGNPGCLLCVRKYLKLNERRKNNDGRFKKVNKFNNSKSAYYPV